MRQVHSIGNASDRVMAALISGLELEFGRGAGEALAARFLDAEESDFVWDARHQERWLGSYDSEDDNDEDGYIELDRVAVMGLLDGRYFVATMIVDGEGSAHGMLGRRSFGTAKAARTAFAAAR